MIPYLAVAALATDRHNALLAEAHATRLARQARCYRQQTGTAANRRSRLRRFRGGSAAAPESLAVTTLGRANGRSPVPTDLGCDAPTAAAPTGVSTMSPAAITARDRRRRARRRRAGASGTCVDSLIAAEARSLTGGEARD
ncbi:MAG: hypothetical protein QOF05_1549 [Sphingomonadales bacterium]|jgi:hypothetical protein|nr:hypothetical protein [Sphingomonadales bacterium]